MEYFRFEEGEETFGDGYSKNFVGVLFFCFVKGLVMVEEVFLGRVKVFKFFWKGGILYGIKNGKEIN